MMYLIDRIFPFLVLLIWAGVFSVNRKAIRVLPFLFLIFISPIYNLLDTYVFINIFGCGCVPIAQTNMLNIPFNANDLRLTVYLIITMIMVFIGIKFSREFEVKKHKIIYIISIALVNIVVTAYYYTVFMWA